MDKKPVTINDLILRLEGQKEEYKKSIGEIMQADGGNLYAMDLISLPVLNRSIKLISGFAALISDENYLCAIPLIRLQLDNSLRFYATFIVSPIDAFVQEFLKGTPIRKLKDRNGKLMKDHYLVEKLDAIFPGVAKLYEDTSGYIHLSDKHFFATISKKEQDNGRMFFGDGSDHFTNEERVNFVYQMAECSKLLLILVNEWKEEKQNKKSQK